MSGRKPALKDRQEWRGRWAWADPFFYWVLLGFTRFLTGSSVSLVMLPLVTNGGNRSEEANRSGEAFELREMNRFVFLLLLPGFTDFRFTGSRCRRSRSLRLRMRRKLQFVDCLVLRQWNNPRQKAKKKTWHASDRHLISAIIADFLDDCLVLLNGGNAKLTCENFALVSLSLFS